MSEPEPHPSFISRAEHDAAVAAHRIALHRTAILFLVVAGVIAWFSYAVYRDLRQSEAVHVAEKALRATAAPGASPQPIVIQVPTAPVIPPSGFFGRGGGSGQTFTRRQEKPTATKPAEAHQTDPKSGAETVVYCPTGEPTKATATDAKTGTVTTTFACPPAPPPPPNVTRFDPPTDKDRKAIEELFPKTPLKDFDLLGGPFDAPRTRTRLRYAAFVPKAGGDLDIELHQDPRSDWAWGRHFELYGEAFRQQSFGVGPSACAGAVGCIAGQPGYGAALGGLLDAFRYKDAHFQPLLEGGWVAGAGYVRIGARVPVCIGAECP